MPVDITLPNGTSKTENFVYLDNPGNKDMQFKFPVTEHSHSSRYFYSVTVVGTGSFVFYSPKAYAQWRRMSPEATKRCLQSSGRKGGWYDNVEAMAKDPLHWFSNRITRPLTYSVIDKRDGREYPETLYPRDHPKHKP